MKVRFEVHEGHLPLWEQKDWAFLMGGRGNGRSGTASRYSISSLLSKEYTRGSIMRAVHSDIRTSSWAVLSDRFAEAGIGEALGTTENEMLLEYSSEMFIRTSYHALMRFPSIST